jgi:hypothetical protein
LKRPLPFALAAALAPGLILCAAALAASPQDKVFTVANYPIDAAAKNAVAAKNKAIEDGQQAAFKSLLKRLVPVNAYNRMERLSAVKAAEYLEGFAVRSEQNSATEYIANMDFSFQADAVRDLLRREGVPFVDAQAQKVVFIPVTRETKPAASGGAAEEAVLKPATGTWAEVWKGLDLDNTLTPMRLEPLKPEIHGDTLTTLLAGDGAGHRVLASEYKSDHVVIAVAEADEAGRRLHVTLSGHDAVGPINWRRSYRLSDGDLDYAQELAAVVSLGVLEGRWKATGDAAADGAGFASAPDIVVHVEFEDMSEWNDIRGRLLNMPGIDDVRVGEVSSRNAEVTLKYAGGAGLLANELAPQGLSLSSIGGSWLLRSSY